MNLDDLKKHDREKLQAEAKIKKQQQIQYKYIGQIRPKTGMTLFEINLDTFEVNPAEYEKTEQLLGIKLLSITQEKKI